MESGLMDLDLDNIEVAGALAGTLASAAVAALRSADPRVTSRDALFLFVVLCLVIAAVIVFREELGQLWDVLAVATVAILAGQGVYRATGMRSGGGSRD